MAALPDSAIIVIVIVVCLAVISLAAALSRHYAPPGNAIATVNPSENQQMYMRSVRQRTLDRFRWESGRIRDLESPYPYDTNLSREPSYYISSENVSPPQYSTSQFSTPRLYSSTQFSAPYT